MESEVEKRARMSISPTHVTSPVSYADVFAHFPPPPPPLPKSAPFKQEKASPSQSRAQVSTPSSSKDSTFFAAGSVTYTEWRNERRKAGRRNVNVLLGRLDGTLPMPFKSLPSPNGAGGRAIGNSGRSLHDVLTDTVRYLSKLKQDNLHKEREVEPKDVVKRALLGATSMLCVEVEGGKDEHSGHIASMGEGAKKFFEHAPCGHVHGHRLAHFVRCEDLPAYHHMLDVSRKQAQTGRTYPKHPGVPQISLMHYDYGEAGASDAPGCRTSKDMLDAKSWQSAFSFDPLLDQSDDEENMFSDVTELPALKCEYVPCDMNVHFATPFSPAGNDKPENKAKKWQESHWKAVILAPLDMARASTERCRGCGGGGSQSGCRSAPLLLPVDTTYTQQPCVMVEHQWHPFLHTSAAVNVFA